MKTKDVHDVVQVTQCLKAMGREPAGIVSGYVGAQSVFQCLPEWAAQNRARSRRNTSLASLQGSVGMGSGATLMCARGAPACPGGAGVWGERWDRMAVKCDAVFYF